MKPSATEMKKVNLKFDRYFDSQKYKLAANLMVKELKKYPREYWLLTNLALINIKLHNYDEALENSKRAYKIEPKDPWVLETHAYVLYENKLYKKSIYYLEKLISNGLINLENNPYSEGKKWAESLFVDLHYALGLSYLAMGEKVKAKSLMELHLKMRKKGLWSKYNKKDIIRKLKLLEG